MDDSSAPSSELLGRYLASEATPDERARIDAWLAADPRRATVLAHLERKLDEPTMTVDVDAAWSRFQPKLPVAAPAAPNRRIVWQIAAAIIVLVGGSLVWSSLRRPANKPAMHEAFALNGQSTTVTLSDGSTIRLNGGSRIRYSNPSAGDRDVYVEGEASFAVHHDAKREFLVHAGAALIRDIGTQFTVRAYAGSEVSVAVSEGSVSLARESGATGATNSVQLRAGDVGVLTDSGQPAVSHPASLDAYTGWTNGTLVLDGYSLARAAAAMERWYDVKIVITDPELAKRPVFARFHNQLPDQAVDAVAMALGARATHSGTTYTISSRKK